jgi:hypothetical protein
MWSVVSPILVRVMAFAALVVFTPWAAKESVLGDTLAAGPVPVPDSETLGAVPEMLLFRTTLPMRLPRTVGLKVILTVQAFPGSNALPQLLVRLKSPVTVTLLVALDVPTSWELNTSDVGENAAFATPVASDAAGNATTSAPVAVVVGLPRLTTTRCNCWLIIRDLSLRPTRLCILSLT